MLELVSAVLGREVESVDQRLADDLGMESVQVLELITRIDARTGVDLGACLAEGARILTLRDVIAEVEKRLADAPRPEPAALHDGAMRPFFFEHDGARLYAVLHPAAGARRGAIVLPPFVHEYFQCGRALRHLGLALARAGVPALRLDFAGVGDSEGSLWEARLEDWIDGIDTAARELRSRAGVEHVTLIGLRLGATVAAEAAARNADAYDLVLWNPIVDGARYTAELETLHVRSLGRRSLATREPGELLGARVHPELLAAIAEVDWVRRSPSLPRRTLLVRGSDDAATRAWLATRPAVEDAFDPETWSWNAFYSSFYWPRSALPRIVDWTGEVR